MRHSWIFALGLAYCLPADALVLFESDFSSFDGAGFAPGGYAGQLDSDAWRVRGLSDGDGHFGATLAGGDFARGRASGGVSGGGVYAFDVDGSSAAVDPALGFQPTSGDLTPGALDLLVRNPYDVNLNDVVVGYDLLVRNNGDRASRYGLHARLLDAPPAEALAAFAFDSPVTRDAGEWQRVRLRARLPGALLAPRQALLLSWVTSDLSGAGARDEFAIDNLQVTAVSAHEPGTLALLALGIGALGAAGARPGRNRPVRAA